MSAQPRPDHMRLLTAQHWLARRLGIRGVLVVFDGVTDPDERRSRLRQAIKARGLDHVKCNTRGVTYAAAFHHIHGEPL